MAIKDLTEFLTPDLELPYKGKTYVVKPPTKETGLKLAAVTAVGISAFGDPEALERIPKEQRELYESIGGVDLGELSLGDTYQQMMDDEVPGPHLDTFAIYAAFYWTMGERIADEVIAARSRKGRGGSPKAPQDRRPSKSGRSTGSGSRPSGSKASRSTPTTGSRKGQPGESFKKEPESGGGKSSNTGT